MADATIPFEPFSPSSRRIHESATNNGWTLYANDRNSLIEYRRKRGEHLRVLFNVRGAWYGGSCHCRRFDRLDDLLSWLDSHPRRPGKGRTTRPEGTR